MLRPKVYKSCIVVMGNVKQIFIYKKLHNWEHKVSFVEINKMLKMLSVNVRLDKIVLS